MSLASTTARTRFNHEDTKEINSKGLGGKKCGSILPEVEDAQAEAVTAESVIAGAAGIASKLARTMRRDEFFRDISTRSTFATCRSERSPL